MTPPKTHKPFCKDSQIFIFLHLLEPVCRNQGIPRMILIDIIFGETPRGSLKVYFLKIAYIMFRVILKKYILQGLVWLGDRFEQMVAWPPAGD